MKLKVLIISLFSVLLAFSNISYTDDHNTKGDEMKEMHSQSDMKNKNNMKNKAKKSGNDSCIKSKGKSKSKNCKKMDE